LDGIVILSELYRTIRNAATLKTFVFVAFDKEECGLFGSHAMVENTPKENLPGSPIRK